MHSAGRRGRGRSVADSRDETSWVGTGQTAMELNQVSYFVNLTETLNFTAAARLSGISQPSLTRAIRRLEEERSEEHTSELQSLMRISYAVFCLKKKTKK